MAKAIHSMIRVLDEARSVAFYETAFGLKVVDRLPFESFTLLYLANDESTFELELTVNAGRAEPYELGDGYGHLAVSVEDLAAEHARLTEAGLAPRQIVEFAPAGAVIARFFFIADPDGYQIEVLQRGGRYL
ncbi:VOC family protein [Acidimangrovimonas pyrenivorans]|uniref:Aldoketomutase n=1 Tax=Acidimangrovimonas pyrenivorans TaxID=2030798 RepID=A0ABV7AJW2_9RHOB